MIRILGTSLVWEYPGQPRPPTTLQSPTTWRTHRATPEPKKNCVPPGNSMAPEDAARKTARIGEEYDNRREAREHGGGGGGKRQTGGGKNTLHLESGGRKNCTVVQHGTPQLGAN